MELPNPRNAPGVDVADDAAGAGSAATDERALVERILGGDAESLGRLVDRLYPPMAAVASAILRDPSHVDDVVQDSWVRVLDGLGAFEFRASLRTWVLRIVSNCALSRARHLLHREQLGWQEEPMEPEPAVDPARFGALGRWSSPPQPWSDREAETVLLRKEVQAILSGELALLPANQRAVVLLRDIEGLSGAEVCSVLGLSDANQRVLLHRGRVRLRGAIERHLGVP